MDWHQLLTDERKRPSTKMPGDSRSAFESDYDRIIYCSAFRRLQHKAQVFPLERRDFVRTRLTHTLEVSTLGRSFGKDVAEKLQEKGIKYFVDNKNTPYDIAYIISSACLIHDVGNPPFGHFGECAIQNWFTNWLNSNTKIKNELTTPQIFDLVKFEGNAQSFRILTKLQYLIDDNGLNLTLATLSALLKYPRLSENVYLLKENVVQKNSENQKKVSYKKHGCFQSEKEMFSLVTEKTGLNDCRHPLAFLMEAADDIANSAADIEDAFKKKAITFERIFDSFRSSLGEKHSVVEMMYKFYHESKAKHYPEPEAIVIQRMRLLLQGRMFRSCVEVFVSNHDQIIEGKFDLDLISNTIDESKDIYKNLINLAEENVYSDYDVISLELIGKQVINGLLDFFVPAILSDQCNDIKKEMGKYYNIISPNFKFIMENYSEQSIYNKIQLATDFVCGMTDSYALDLYQKLSGYKIV